MIAVQLTFRYKQADTYLHTPQTHTHRHEQFLKKFSNTVSLITIILRYRTQSITHGRFEINIIIIYSELFFDN